MAIFFLMLSNLIKLFLLILSLPNTFLPHFPYVFARICNSRLFDRLRPWPANSSVIWPSVLDKETTICTNSHSRSLTQLAMSTAPSFTMMFKRVRKVYLLFFKIVFSNSHVHRLFCFFFPSTSIFRNDPHCDSIVTIIFSGYINYLSVLNEEGSYAAVCDFPTSLGSSRTYFSVRVVPNSRSKLRLYVAAHVWTINTSIH